LKEFLYKKNLNISLNKNNLYIKKVIYNEEIKDIYKCYIPPIEINYNFNGSILNYKKLFLEKAFKDYFPIIIKYCSAYSEKNNYNNFLDLGCGYGPMAVAFLNFIKLQDEKSDSKYLGIDINKTAIDWLKIAYKDNSQFKFLWHYADLQKDYLQSKSLGIETNKDSDGSEVEYDLEDFKYNIQWSMSYFTHLTPTACDKILKLIYTKGEEGAMQFNSWLIIDKESKFALQAKMANRLLPYDMGTYLTRSNINPLTVTAYKEDFIKNIYKKNNLKIIDILKGNWRGTNNYDNNFKLSQDLIVSKKI
jgi:hypothetical protein